MSKPTTGERIVMDTLEYDAKTLRTSPRCGSLRVLAAAIDAAIDEAVKEWKRDAEKYRRVIASRVERELSKDAMIHQMLASGKSMTCTPEVSARCEAANAEVDAAYTMLADDVKSALADAIRARSDQ